MASFLASFAVCFVFQSIADSYGLRRTALTQGIPYYTTVAGARAALLAIEAMSAGGLEVAPLQSYFNSSF